MGIEGLLDERDRLLGQRADILRALAAPVLASDLSEETQDSFRISIEEALDDAFFDLLDPVEADIAEHEAATAWRRRTADLIDLRSRQ